MNRDILALDFYGEGITAALASLDEATDTLRIRHLLRHPCKAFAGAFVRNKIGAQEELTYVFSQMSEFVSSSPSIIAGIRGSFLSFHYSTGFAYTQARSRIIRDEDIENAIHDSIPSNLDESLEVLDILPQSYSIDGQPGAIDPKGMSGCCLGAETFISLGVSTHLTNLKNVLTACGCEDFLWMPTSVALADSALTAAEKSGACLLIDIGENTTSAVLYYKDSLKEAWEMPFGLDIVAQSVSDQLQNDFQTARQLLHNYEPDPIMDEVLEDASVGLLQAIHKELVQSLTYIQRPPTHAVLCGQGAWPVLQKGLKNKLGLRKARLCSFDKLIADCDIDHPQYDGVLALLQHALTRERNQLGVAQIKEDGLLGKLFTKLGFNVF